MATVDVAGLFPNAVPMFIAVESLNNFNAVALTPSVPWLIVAKTKILLEADDGVMLTDNPVTSTNALVKVELAKVSVLFVDTTCN